MLVAMDVHVSFGHALAPPPREVRHEDIVTEVEFRFVEDPPSPRTAAAALKMSSIPLGTSWPLGESTGSLPAAGLADELLEF